MKMRILIIGLFLLSCIIMASCYCLGNPVDEDLKTGPAGTEVFNE